MATAGMSGPMENPTMSCVDCGLDMIAAAASQPPYWNLRVGVHVGPVIGGIVGKRKYQFDVWGDTVNTAARMEQSGLPDTFIGKVCDGIAPCGYLFGHLLDFVG